MIVRERVGNQNCRADNAQTVAEGGKPTPSGWEVTTHGGRRGTGIDAIEWCRQVAALGAGEILLTSMDRDGTQGGFDLALTRAVSDASDE